jgi:hypothetical protein
MPETANSEEVTSPGKLLKEYRNQPWWVIVLIAVLPSTMTGLFSYRVAVVEAKAKTAESDRKSEAGYEELVKAVRLLQDHDEAKAKLDVENAKTLAGAVAAINAIEMMIGSHEHLDRPSLHVVNPHAARLPTPPPAPSPAAAAATASPRIQLSKSLDEAAKK